MSELTIVEQLALIAQDAEAEYQAMLMWACLFGLAAGALAGVVYTVRLSAAERRAKQEAAARARTEAEAKRKADRIAALQTQKP